MSAAFTLSRRSFVLAGAALGAMALLPHGALAQAADAPGGDTQDFDPTGTWVLVATACDDEEVAESLALIAALSTTVYELRADGTLTCTMAPVMEVAEDEGQDSPEEPSNFSGSPADAPETTETSETTAVDDLGKALSETVSEEGTWEVTGADAVTLSTDDGAALVCVKNGLGLTYTGRDEDGLTITMTFARPEDVLSGDWAMAASPDTFEPERDGIKGRWGCVAWVDPTLSDVQAAHYTAVMLGLYGTSWTMDILEDGSLTMQLRSAGEEEATVSEGTWHEPDADAYECEIDDQTLSLRLADGRLILDMDESTFVFVPLAQTD